MSQEKIKSKEKETCPECSGRKKVTRACVVRTRQITCPTCEGSGKVRKEEEKK